MKTCVIILFISLNAASSFSQTMFFDNLNNSVWTSNAGMNDSVIRFASPIGLQKFYEKDLLKRNVTIWTFKDGVLTLEYFDINQQKDSLVATWKYQIDKEKVNWELNIILEDGSTLVYVVGIVSTGTFAELTRSKKKIIKK